MTNKFQQALLNGKVVYSDMDYPRYYKYSDGVLYYSDDLKDWSISKSDLNMFTDGFSWGIKE